MNILVAGFGIGTLLGIFMTNSTAPEPPCQPGKVVCPDLPEYSPQVWDELGKEMHVLDPDIAVAKFVRDYIRTRATIAHLCAST